MSKVHDRISNAWELTERLSYDRWTLTDLDGLSVSQKKSIWWGCWWRPFLKWQMWLGMFLWVLIICLSIPLAYLVSLGPGEPFDMIPIILASVVGYHFVFRRIYWTQFRKFIVPFLEHTADGPTEAGEAIHPRDFVAGKRYKGPTPSIVPIDVEGRRVEFNLASFDMPVVSKEIGSTLEPLAPDDFERYPVMVDSEWFEIINIVRIQNCLDEGRSEVMRWTEEDERPERAGQYRMVSNLTVDPGRTGGANIFRVEGWEISLIVSDRVKKALEDILDLGIIFEPVVRNS